jgi:hypothetical protein
MKINVVRLASIIARKLYIRLQLVAILSYNIYMRVCKYIGKLYHSQQLTYARLTKVINIDLDVFTNGSGLMGVKFKYYRVICREK